MKDRSSCHTDLPEGVLMPFRTGRQRGASRIRPSRVAIIYSISSLSCPITSMTLMSPSRTRSGYSDSMASCSALLDELNCETTAMVDSFNSLTWEMRWLTPRRLALSASSFISSSLPLKAHEKWMNRLWSIINQSNQQSTMQTSFYIAGLEILQKQLNSKEGPLEELVLNSSTIEGPLIAYLGYEHMLNRLITLKLQNCRLGKRGAIQLIKLSMPRLQGLTLHKNYITEQGTAQMILHCDWPRLKYLTIVLNDVGMKGSQMISKSAMAPRLEALTLSCAGIGDEGCFWLRRANLSSLISLNLSFNGIGAAGAKLLSRSAFPALQYFSASCNSLETEGVEYLGRARWPKLQNLVLDLTKVDNIGMTAIRDAEWPSLRHLSLRRNFISSNGIKTLCQMKSLDSINLKQNILKRSDIQSINKAFLGKVIHIH